MDENELIGMVPEDNREAVQQFIQSLNPLSKLDEKSVGRFIEQNDVLKSYRDRFFKDSLENWQKNNLDKIYQERYAKEHPEETEEQKRIKELEIKFAEKDRQQQQAELRLTALNIITEMELPKDAANYISGNDEKELRKSAEGLKAILDAHEGKVREGIIREHGRTPEKATDHGDKYYTIDQINEMSAAEYSQNSDKVLASIKYHQSLQSR